MKQTHITIFTTPQHTPTHFKTGGPFGEFLRIRRNCNRIADYEKHSKDRMIDYRRRGYPMKMIKKAQRQVQILNRDSLLTPRNNPLVVTFNPANPNFHKILEQHWHILQLSINKDAFCSIQETQKHV